jgi:hypothetical protein
MLRQTKTYLVIFLLICAAINGSHIFSFSKQTSIDFRNLYLGSRIWLEGGNPYTDSELKKEWAAVCEEEYLDPETQPGLPQNFLVYPPYALILFAPFGLLNWHAAIVLHFIMELFCLIVIIISVLKAYPDPRIAFKYKFLVLTAVLLGLKGTAHAAVVGQPSFVCIAAALLAYVYVQRNKKYIAPLLLIVASIKPTIALPIWLFLIIHKEWKTIFSALAGIFILLCAVLLAYTDMYAIVESFIRNGIALQSLIYEHGTDYPYNYHMVSGTQLQIIIELITAKATDIQTWISAAILLAGSIYVYVKRNNTSRLYQLCILIVTCLLATYHLFYDTMMLLPVVAITGYTANKKTIWLLVACLPMFIPINGILNQFPSLQPLSFLYFSLPVSVLLVGIWLLSFETNRQRESSAL